MHRLIKVMIIMVAVSGLVSAQVWTYDSDFFVGSSPHGVVVDPAGKIWITQYAQNDTLSFDPDTVTASAILVFNSDGTQADFSPISTVTVDGVTDTLIYNNRGISLDANGNILTCSGFLYRINYQTGEGMNKYDFESGGALALTEAGADSNGFLYITRVAAGHSLVILDSDFEPYSSVTDSVPSIQRSVLVSPDGNDVYVGAIYTAYNGILHYHSDDGPDGTYALVDTIYGFDGVWGQILDWDANGLLWVGTYWDVDPGEFTGWYGLDPTQSYFAVDTIGHNVGENPLTGETPPAGGSYYAPRGVAWSLDGLTAYTADFDGGVVKKWTNSDPAVPGDPPIVPALTIDHERGNPIIAVEFTLHQNYPNPFNPATTIPFDLKDAGLAKLVVYDVAGREVATLVNEPKTPGNYRVLFDASELPSGMYIYQLEFKNRTVSKRMTYVK